MAAGITRIAREICFTLEKKSTKIFENIFLNNGVLAALGMNGRVKIVRGGDQFHERVHLGENSTIGHRGKFTQIPTDMQNNFRTAKYGHALCSGTAVINLVEEDENAGEHRISDMAEGLVDWVGFIDVDELLAQWSIDQLDNIRQEKPKVSTIRMMRQRLMGNRFCGKKTIKFSDITESWGVIPDKSYKHRGNGKSFVRPGRGRWKSPHRAYATDNGIDVKSLDLQFIHFHGLEATDKTLEVGWDKIYQWAKRNARKQKYTEHVDILKAKY